MIGQAVLKHLIETVHAPIPMQLTVDQVADLVFEFQPQLLGVCEVFVCGLSDSRPHIVAVKFDYDSLDTPDSRKERKIVEDIIFIVVQGMMSLSSTYKLFKRVLRWRM